MSKYISSTSYCCILSNSESSSCLMQFGIISVGFVLLCLQLLHALLSQYVPNAAIKTYKTLNSSYSKCQDYFLQSSLIPCCVCMRHSKTLISPFCRPVFYHFYYGYPFYLCCRNWLLYWLRALLNKYLSSRILLYAYKQSQYLRICSVSWKVDCN
jgi:hypothetical protein